MVKKYAPMKDAPHNRTIISDHFSRGEIEISWTKRSGLPPNSYSGNKGPQMIDGWAGRDDVYVIPEHELRGWRETDEF